MLIFSGAPETPDDINSLINHYVEECLSILRNSEALNDLDLESEDGVHTAAERVGSTDALRGSLEQWAFTVLSALAETTQAFDQNNAQRAAWAMNRATSAHAMLVLRRDLEDTMWRGYVTQSLRDVLQIWQDNQLDLSPCLKAGDSWAEHSGPGMLARRRNAVTGLHVHWGLGCRPRSTGVDSRRPCGMQAVYHTVSQSAIHPQP